MWHLHGETNITVRAFSGRDTGSRGCGGAIFPAHTHKHDMSPQNDFILSASNDMVYLYKK